RANAVRLLPSSTTAMFIGTPISSALARAASTTAWAVLSVTLSATLPPSIRCWSFDTIASRDASAARPAPGFAAERQRIERAIGVEGVLEGPTALALVDGDAVLAAKAISTFSRSSSVLAYKGGIMDGSPLDAEGFQAIARLPGVDVLRGQLVGMAASPLTGLA